MKRFVVHALPFLFLASIAAPARSQQTPAQQVIDIAAQLQAKQQSLLASQRPLADARVLCERAIDLALTMNPPPQVPDEAVEDEGAANSLMNPQNSPTEADLTQAGNNLVKAITLAPFWPDAYFNLGVFREHQARAIMQTEPDKARALLEDGIVAFQLYLKAKPGASDRMTVLARIGGLRALTQKTQEQKQIIAQQHAEAATAAEQQKDEADWKKVSGALAAVNKQTALTGPWACSYYCTGANLSIAGSVLSGSVNTQSEVNQGSRSAKSTTTIAISGMVSNGTIQGQANFPAYTMGPCSVAADAQDLSGTISDDGRTMVLQTTLLNYTAHTQGLLVPICTNVEQTGSQTLRMKLSSQAPQRNPLLDSVVMRMPGTGIDTLEAVRLVLAHNPNVNLNGVNANQDTALHLAAALGEANVVALLLDHGAQVGVLDNHSFTPLYLAVRAKSPDTVRVLLLHGARAGSISGNSSPLGQAVGTGSTDLVAQLLPHVSDPGELSYGLYFATDQSLATARMLLEHGANVNTTQLFGMTPLAIDILRGCGNAYEFAIVHLHQEAKRLGCESAPVAQAVSLLLDHGANVNAADSDGVTPLMLAAETADLDVVKLLLAHGADLHAKDRKGHTAMEYAKQGRDQIQIKGYRRIKRTARDKEVIQYFEHAGLKS